jgi:hypothetical protein
MMFPFPPEFELANAAVEVPNQAWQRAAVTCEKIKSDVDRCLDHSDRYGKPHNTHNEWVSHTFLGVVEEMRKDMGYTQRHRHQGHAPQMHGDERTTMADDSSSKEKMGKVRSIHFGVKEKRDIFLDSLAVNKREEILFISGLKEYCYLPKRNPVHRAHRLKNTVDRLY